MNRYELRPLVQAAAFEIASHDPKVQTVGLSLKRGRPVLWVVRRAALRAQSNSLPEQIEDLPLVVETAQHALVPLYKIPGAAAQASALPEQDRQRPLVLGLQVQNTDQDERDGTLAQGYRTVGTLGCFVRNGGVVQILSNNHVLAGENTGQIGDRIQQPRALEIVDEDIIARLSAFVPLAFADEGHLGMAEGVNLVDAAMANLTNPSANKRAYLPHHLESAPRRVREPQLDEHVYKIGRTTGLTRGQIRTVFIEAGPVGYGAGTAYFRQSSSVRGLMKPLNSKRRIGLLQSSSCITRLRMAVG